MLLDDSQTTRSNTSLITGRAGTVLVDTTTTSIPGEIIGFQILTGEVTVNSSEKIADHDPRAENISGITYTAVGEWTFPAREVNITTTGKTLVFLG